MPNNDKLISIHIQHNISKIIDKKSNIFEVVTLNVGVWVRNTSFMRPFMTLLILDCQKMH